MIVNGKQLDTQHADEADICILGGGVAGLTIARELKDKFNKIVIIESGDQGYSLDLQKMYSAHSRPKFFPDTSTSRLRMLGGSSNHWENNTSPFDPLDFEVKDWVKDSGWPISYKELEPFYPRAGEYCGVQSDGYDSHHWSGKFKEQNPLKKSDILTIGIAKASTPPTRFFAEYGDDINTDNIIIYTNSIVVDLDFNTSDNKVKQVFFKTTSNTLHTVKAKIFVLCFGGIENARMLLTFNKKYKNRLGNAYDNVGRYFMDHPTVRAAQLFIDKKDKYAFYTGKSFNERTVVAFWKLTRDACIKNKVNNLRMPLIETTNYVLSDAISSHHILSQAIKEKDLPDSLGTHIWNYLSDLDMVIEAVYRKKYNKPFFDDSNEFGAYELAIMMEQSPSRDNRIYLSDAVDQYGLHKIAIDWELKEDDIRQLWKALELVGVEVGKLSLGRLKLLTERGSRLWGDQMGFGHHHMGTTKMALNVQNGVVDKDSKVFGTENFYIAGSSVFPTGGHVPPTLTIVALSIRLAQHISKALRV